MGKQQEAAAIGARIRRRRTERGLTQAQVGEPEFTPGYISMIESGRRRPSDGKLAVIAERLGMDLNELLTGRPAGLEAQLEVQLHLARRQVDEGDIGRATDAVSQVRDTAKDNRLNRVEARAEEALAAIAERGADISAALDHYRRAEELWDGEAVHLRATAVTGVASCVRMMGDAPMSVHLLDYYRRDLVATGQPHPDALMQTYTEMVYAYFAVGLPEKAGDAARNALRLENQVDDPDEIACMHLTVAQSLLYEERFGDALDSIRRAHELYSAGGWRNKAAKARIAEAFVLCNKSGYVDARELLVSALDLLSESPNRQDEAMTLDQLGHVMRQLGDVRAGADYLERARSLLEDADVEERAFNQRETGLCLRALGDPASEEHLKHAIDLYRLGGQHDELARTYKELGDLYAARGEKDLALSTFREGLESVEKPPR